MKQQTLAVAADQGAGFERFRRRTKREDFLDAMNAIVPWAALCAVIELIPGQRQRCGAGCDAARPLKAAFAQSSHGYLFANARSSRIRLMVHDGFGVWWACAAPKT